MHELSWCLTCRFLWNRSQDEGLVSSEWLAHPSLVSDNCISVVCLSWSKVDARSESVLAADTNGYLQYRLCLPLCLHVHWGFLQFVPNILNKILPSVLWHCWLGGKKGIRSVKNWDLRGVWSEVQTCIWPSCCHCHSLSLASVKSRLVLPFWYRLTWIVPDKGLLNVCVSKYVSNKCIAVCKVATPLRELTFHTVLPATRQRSHSCACVCVQPIVTYVACQCVCWWQP